MRITSASLAVACLLLAPACITGKPKVFSVDPERRGFELPERPVIVFFVDGLRPDVLDDLARRGYLPRLQRQLLDRAAHVRSAVACVPSVTSANAVSMLTGCWPTTHGIWANAWFDRHQLRMRNYEDQRDLAALDESRETIFELLDGELTAGIALPFDRGLKLMRAKSLQTGGRAFGLDWILGRKSEADERLTEQFYEIGETASAIGEWPAFIAVYIPAVDEIGHEHGCDSDEYWDAVLNLDAAIGNLLEAFELGGMLDELTLVLTSDHGHHPAPHSLALDEHLSFALGTPALIHRANDGETAYIDRWKLYAPEKAVVVLNGYRQASVHLRAGKRWGKRPTLEQILDNQVPERLLRSVAVDLVAVRAGSDEVRVYGRGGAAAIRRTADDPSEPLFTYEVLEGSDPLGYDSDGALREWMRTAHGSREWLTATAELRYPDLVPQLASAFDDPRSGDLVFFAAPGWDFNAEKYAGGHGGVEREEMLVPLYIAGPGIRAGAELPAARLVDLVPTLLDLAGVTVDDSVHFDGVSLAEQLK